MKGKSPRNRNMTDKQLIEQIMESITLANKKGEWTISDSVNHPPHYNAHPAGIECITITEHMNFNLGNAVKYLWRVGLKSEDAITDLEKARWYVDREIARLKKAGAK